MRPVEFHPAAADEADEAYDYYDARDRSVARRFKAELDRLLDLARQQPHLFAPHVAGTRRAVLQHAFPYSIIYVDQPDLIRVIAVAHAKRRPGYWRRRLTRP